METLVHQQRVADDAERADITEAEGGGAEAEVVTVAEEVGDAVEVDT